MLGRLLLASCVIAAATNIFIASSSAAPKLVASLGNQASYSDEPQAALFGTRETYSQSIWNFPQWTDMLARTTAEQQSAHHVCMTRSDTSCVPQEWETLLGQMRGLDLSRQIEIANEELNRVPYVTTEENWHRPMYWETAFEFLRFGGQCQDYAIAKYELLRAAGVPADVMRIVILHDMENGLDHAVLAVYVDGEPMLLDNLRPDIVSASRVTDYRPYYSINENGWWYHFGGQAMSVMASR